MEETSHTQHNATQHARKRSAKQIPLKCSGKNEWIKNRAQL